MAQYQIGNEVYELPDNLPPQQLNQILRSLAGGKGEPDTSFSSAFQSGIDAPLENMATTARMLGFEGTADTLSNATNAPVNYESASDRFMNPQEGDFTVAGFAPEYLPRAAVEQAGQIGGSLATRAGGGIVGGIVSGGNPLGVAGGALAGPALFEFVQQLGPVAQQRAANNGRTEPTWEDWSAAAATAGVSGALNSIGVKGFSGAGLLNRTLKEGITEGGQSVVEQTGSTAGTEAGLNIDPKQALGEAIIGGTSAGGIGVATDTAAATGRGVKNLTNRVFNPDDGLPTDPEGAAELAQRLSGIAEANSYDLNDIDKMSTKGARETVDKAHVQLAEELKQVAKDLKERLAVTDADELSTVIEKVMAQAGQREARNKTKNTVGVQETQAIESLTGDTAEGQRMLKIIRQLNELTELHNSGYQGGLSRITDQFSPLGSSVGYDRGAVATERLLRPIVSGGAALQTGGASLLGQAAIAGAGRAVDALTGRRSRVRRFIEQNKSNQGITEPQGLRSLRGDKQTQQLADEQAAAAEEARQKALALEGTQLNDPPKGDPNDLQNSSPQFLMEYASGLNRRGVADALAVIRRINPKLRKAADSYQTMLEEGTRVKDLTPLIKRVRGLKKRRPDLFNDTSTGTTPSEAVQAKVEESANYQRGIQSNLEFVKNQKKKIDNDNLMNAFDKGVAKDALDKLGLNLGSKPAETAVSILNKAITKARNKDKIREYVAPYVERVAGQQRNAKKPEGIEQVNEMAMFDPIDFGEYDTETNYYHGTASAFQEFDAGKRGAETGAKSARLAFWFTDDPSTAAAYADFAGTDTPVQRLVKQSQDAERRGDYDEADLLMSKAEMLEEQLLADPAAGQNIIPVMLPKNLKVIDMDGAKYDPADDATRLSDQLKDAKREGYDGVKFINFSDTPFYGQYRPATHVAIFDPAKIRSKFAPVRDINADQKPFEPFLTEEFLGRPLTESEIRANEDDRSVYDLRNQLDALQMRAGEGILKGRNPQSDIGNMAIDFDPRKVSEYRKKINIEATAMLDPEGRFTISALQAGLEGKGGMTTEQLALLIPSIVRSLVFMSGKRGDQVGAFGRYARTMVNDVIKRDRIDIIDINEKFQDARQPLGKGLMHTAKFLDTLLHEVGHAIAARSDLEKAMFDMQRMDKDEAYYQLMDEAASVSKIRRPELWDALETAIDALQKKTGYWLGPAGQSYQLNLQTMDDVYRLQSEIFKTAMNNGIIDFQEANMSQTVEALLQRIKYMNNPPELAADAVAMYLSNPDLMKDKFPLLAKQIRRSVNESAIAEHITFHSLAGLLGATGMLAAVQAALGGGEEDDETGILSLGRGALST